MREGQKRNALKREGVRGHATDGVGRLRGGCDTLAAGPTRLSGGRSLGRSRVMGERGGCHVPSLLRVPANGRTANESRSRGNQPHNAPIKHRCNTAYVRPYPQTGLRLTSPGRAPERCLPPRWLRHAVWGSAKVRKAPNAGHRPASEAASRERTLRRYRGNS